MEATGTSPWAVAGSGSTPSHSETSCRGATPPVARSAIEGVIFDTADVLYDATLWPRRLLRLVRGLGVKTTYAEFHDAWERHYLADVHCGRRNYEEAFQSFLLAFGLTWAQIDEVEAANRIERQSLDSEARALPGVLTTIATLCRWRIRLVAWADAPRPACAVADYLDRLGLSGRFVSVLSSFDLEAALPDVVCYQTALAALDLPAERVAYVGHDALHLAGARATGLRTIAFNYQQGAEADHFLSSFDELLPLVRASLDAGQSSLRR